MTGRDLIVYILANNLENEPVFKDGRFIGFITAGEVAEKMNVGIATIWAWVAQGRLEGVYFKTLKDDIYIPANYKLLSEGVNE